jgi:hypothetical protein
MPTRVYTNSSGTVGVTPSTWNFANQINPVTVPGTLTQNTGSAMLTKVELCLTSATARAMGRTILGPLAAQTISGTVKGQMRGAEQAGTTNATLAMAVKLVQPSGADRAVLLAQTASDSATTGIELAVTTLTNARFFNVTEVTPIPFTTQTAIAGDFLVIEWGFRSNTITAQNVTLSYGNDSATDLTDADTTVTAANNPWWEFSGTITLDAGATPAPASAVLSATLALLASSVVAPAVTLSASLQVLASSLASGSVSLQGQALVVATTLTSGSASLAALAQLTASQVRNAVGTTTAQAQLLASSLGAGSAQGTALAIALVQAVSQSSATLQALASQLASSLVQGSALTQAQALALASQVCAALASEAASALVNVPLNLKAVAAQLQASALVLASQVRSGVSLTAASASQVASSLDAAAAALSAQAQALVGGVLGTGTMQASATTLSSQVTPASVLVGASGAPAVLSNLYGLALAAVSAQSTRLAGAAFAGTGQSVAQGSTVVTHLVASTATLAATCTGQAVGTAAVGRGGVQAQVQLQIQQDVRRYVDHYARLRRGR